MEACPECDGLLIQDDGSEDFLLEPIDSYYCPGCGWSSDDASDTVEELSFDQPARPDKPCCNCGKVTTTVSCIIEGVQLNGEPSDAGEHCYDCCQKEGYCFGCGRFSAGMTSYDFSRIGAYCDNCQEQIRSTVADFDEDDDEFYDSLP